MGKQSNATTWDTTCLTCSKVRSCMFITQWMNKIGISNSLTGLAFFYFLYFNIFGGSNVIFIYVVDTLSIWLLHGACAYAYALLHHVGCNCCSPHTATVGDYSQLTDSHSTHIVPNFLG